MVQPYPYKSIQPPLEGMPTMQIGIDAGASKIAVGTDDPFAPTKLFKVSGHFSRDIHNIIDAVQELSSEFAEPLTGIGLAAPGTLNAARTRIDKSANLPYWEGRDVVTWIQDAFTSARVVLGNDVEAQALGEAYYGHGRNFPTVLLVGWGTGIGSATVSTVSGKPVVTPGELGHTELNHTGMYLCGCKQFGCLEYFAGGGSIVKRYSRLASDMSWPQWSEVLNYMAIALKNTLTANPVDLVAFSGSVALHNADRIEQLRQRVIERTTFQKIPPFEITALGANLGTVGAAALLNQF